MPFLYSLQNAELWRETQKAASRSCEATSYARTTVRFHADAHTPRARHIPTRLTAVSTRVRGHGTHPEPRPRCLDAESSMLARSMLARCSVWPLPRCHLATMVARSHIALDGSRSASIWVKTSSVSIYLARLDASMAMPRCLDAPQSVASMPQSSMQPRSSMP